MFSPCCSIYNSILGWWNRKKEGIPTNVDDRRLAIHQALDRNKYMVNQQLNALVTQLKDDQVEAWHCLVAKGTPAADALQYVTGASAGGRMLWHGCTPPAGVTVR
jgi:hypothetical protein